MKTEIKQIVAEIMAMDPNLAGKEADIQAIAEALLKIRPEIQYDEKFLLKLKNDLIKEAGKKKMEAFFTLPRLSFAFSGAVVAVLVVVLVLPKFNNADSKIVVNNETNQSEEVEQKNPIQEIIANAGNAYGSLGSIFNAGFNNGAMQGKGIGGGGGALLSESSAMSPVADRKMAYSDAQIGIPYKPNPLTINYDAGDFSVDISGKVYRKEKSGIDDALNTEIRSLSMFEMSRFQNPRVRSLEIFEDRDEGYTLYYNAYDESVSINANWEKWPALYPACVNGVCPEQKILPPSDVPSDEELIRIASEFVSRYGIDISKYGAPVLQNWKPAGVPEQELYVPDQLQVVYPSLLDGQEVYDYGANKYGIAVGVNIRVMKAVSIYNLTSYSYSNSEYEIETDANRIIELAKKGGMNQMYGDGGEVSLEKPTFGLFQYYRSSPDGRSSEILFLPAAFFKVVPKESGRYYQSHVIVPLLKEIMTELEKMHENFPKPEPRPLPMPVEPKPMDNTVISGDGSGVVASPGVGTDDSVGITGSEPAIMEADPGIIEESESMIKKSR